MKLLAALALTLTFTGSICEAANSTRIEAPVANILMSFLYNQDFSKCEKIGEANGEIPTEVVCVAKNLDCFGSSFGYGLGAGFEISKDASCYSHETKKALSADLALGMMAALRVVGQTGPDGFYLDDKLSYDQNLKSISCHSYFSSEQKNFCEVELKFE